ncbi:MAG: hypothetical protein WCZ89_06650 [Phycisphaerae bacterium]
MAITFNCEFCGKKIEAQEKNAGKWGKCPSCHNKIYVPNPETEEEELKLAPIDEEEEERKKRLIEETFMLEQQILNDKPTPEQKFSSSKPAAAHVDEDVLYETIVRYLRQMADGELDQAESTLRSIKSAGEIAFKLIDQIAAADIPEADLSDIPSQVLSGLIRTLRSEIQ